MAESAGSRFGGLDAGGGAGGLPIRERQVLTPEPSRASVNTSPSAGPALARCPRMWVELAGTAEGSNRR